MSVGPNKTGQIAAKAGRMLQRDNMQRRVDQHLAAENAPAGQHAATC
jgi:hypothetical protein